MSGSVWMFSDQIDDEDMDFMRHEFVTYSMASDYYGLGLKPVTRMAHECGAIYKIGRKILIRSRMYKRYLKEHHSARYQALLLSGRLNSYLADIDAQAEEQLELLTQQMAEREGVNEELKAANQMEWVQRMNRIQNRAEEVIKTTLIYH